MILSISKGPMYHGANLRDSTWKGRASPSAQVDRREQQSSLQCDDFEMRNWKELYLLCQDIEFLFLHREIALVENRGR